MTRKPRNTVNKNVRLKFETDRLLTELAETNNISTPEYIRRLILKDIDSHIKVKRDPNYHRVELDISLAIATILQIARQQNENVQITISENANPIYEKILDTFANARAER